MTNRTHTRRHFLKTLGVGAAAAMAAPRTLVGQTGAKKPNVIIVITDDQGYGDLACHGNPYIKTPNLDKLYTQSTRLTNYHVGPTCAPTRAALLTGRYCNRTGVWHTIMGRSILRKDERTLGHMFSEGGYSTAMFGKWHLGDNYPSRPRYMGFAHVRCHGGGGVGQTPDYWGNDYFDDTYNHNGTFVKHEGYCTDIWFAEGMKFIMASVQAKKPFFAYLSTNAPHGPFNVAKKYSDMYAGVKGVPNANFYGMITNIDDNMGLLVKQLDKLGIADDTILIFTTDNGTAAGVSGRKGGGGFNAGMRGTKGSEYDGGHRVPMFIRWAGGKITPGLDIKRLTAHVDIMPTLAELCGIATPKAKLDGKSIVPLLRGKDATWGDRVLVTDSQRIENPQKWRKSATMTDRWRLINGKELYDMSADPGQKNNVADQHPEVIARLRKAYNAWWADVSKQFGEYVPIIIGSPKENPTCLTSHDWHGSGANRSWNHRQIAGGGGLGNGFWAVDVDRPGTYEMKLMRWPVQAKRKLREKFLDVAKARLTVANVDETVKVGPEANSATFKVKLPAGETKLQAQFIDAKGKAAGAFFVYVNYVGK